MLYQTCTILYIIQPNLIQSNLARQNWPKDTNRAIIFIARFLATHPFVLVFSQPLEIWFVIQQMTLYGCFFLILLYRTVTDITSDITINIYK